MTSPQNFRSAFNGFHREDVVNYISFISKKHDTLVAELRSEIEELRTRVEEHDDAPDLTGELEQRLEALEQEKEEALQNAQTLSEQVETLRAEADALRGEVTEKNAAGEAAAEDLARAQAENAALKEELAQQKAAAEALKQELQNLQAAAAQQPAPNDSARGWSEELNAYRRAERTERRARERVNQMYDQANGALAEASVRMERAAADITALTAKVEADLKLLHQAMTESGNTMADTAVMLGSIRPELD